MTTPDQLQAVTDRIVERFKPLQIILFGSLVRGDTHQWSDIDLLVVLPRVEDKWKTKLEIEKELRDVSGRADVTATTPEEIRRRGDMVGTVLRPALREGKVLYAKKGDTRMPETEPVSEEEVQREVAEWLIFAEDDLAAGEHLIEQPNLVPRGAGFQAQRAAELALKAVYIFLKIQYEFTHDLDKLCSGLPAGWRLREQDRDLHALSMWAVAQQYPTVQGQLTRDDVRRHVQQARNLLEAIRRDLREHGFTGDV